MMCGDEACVNHAHNGRCVLPRYCGTWECRECRKVRLKRLLHEIAGGAPTIFLTLTWWVRPGWTFEAAARAQRAAWAKYVALFNRKHGPKALQYIVVCEATLKGWPHLHIAARAKWIPHKALSKFMKAEIDSPVVDVQSLKQVRSVAKYLAKYLSKGPHQFATLKRYWKTLGYLLPAYFEDRAYRRRSGSWCLDPRSWQEIAFDAVLRGFKIEKLDPGVFIRAKAPP